MPVTNEHEAVHRIDVFISGFDKSKEISGRDSLLLRAAPWKLLRVRSEGNKQAENNNSVGFVDAFHLVCRVICGLVCQIDSQRRDEQPEQPLHEEEQKAPETEP